MAIKFIIKPVTSFGVFAHEDSSDGSCSSDRLIGTYDGEKTAQCVADALNEEAGEVTYAYSYPTPADSFNKEFQEAEEVGCSYANSAGGQTTLTATEEAASVVATDDTGASVRIVSGQGEDTLGWRVNAASNPDRVQAQADLNASYTTLEEITLTNGHAPQETD